MELNQVIILVIIGMSAGILSGMFGIGGGLLMVPAMVYFLDMSQREAQGTSLGLMLLPVGILAAWGYHKHGNMNIKYGLIIAATFVIGGYFGQKVAHLVNENLLKKIFGVVMILAALKMIFSK